MKQQQQQQQQCILFKNIRSIKLTVLYALQIAKALLNLGRTKIMNKGVIKLRISSYLSCISS